jgi:poly(ADP-ribose) glycohydrolase ARH3
MKSMDKNTLRSKYLGSIFGTALGDALGAPFEGSRSVGDAEVSAVASQQAVLNYTDDTHMMIGMAESLISQKGFDADHMAKRFAENYFEDPHRGYGPGPPRIFSRIAEGIPWEKASEEIYPGGSYGNGSAMRIAPLALFYYDDFTALKDAACLSSRITHAHILGQEGAALQAHTIALAVSLNSSFSPIDVIKNLKQTVTQDIYRQRLTSIRDLLGCDIKNKVVSELGNSIISFNSIPSAIFCFLSFPNSFEDAVTYAISLGGDTDTIGAMTGAISGAFLGIEALPQKWLSRLEDFTLLEELALGLWKLKQ